MRVARSASFIDTLDTGAERTSYGISMHKCWSFVRTQRISQRKRRTITLLAWLHIASWTISRTWNMLTLIIVVYFRFVYGIKRSLTLRTLYIILKSMNTHNYTSLKPTHYGNRPHACCSSSSVRSIKKGCLHYTG
jgi:hypothetical protein